MLSTSFLLRWGFLLGVALVLPLSLPVGGMVALDRVEIRRRHSSGTMLAGSNSILRSSPINTAAVLQTLSLGTPLKVLRTWEGIDGKKWIHVQVKTINIDSLYPAYRRGWLDI